MNAVALSSENSARGEVLPLLHRAADLHASDVHLAPGYPVSYRIHGKLTPQGGVLDGDAVRRLVDALTPERLRPMLAADGKNFDFSVSLTHHGRPCRFRANVFVAQGQWGACLRHVPNDIPSFEWMGFPAPLAERLISFTNGLVIITGVTGSGKSTTLAGLIHLLNERGDHRIITVEEPIEYVHRPISSTMITQREVGRDVDSFLDGLKYGLRQDPDVILVGEIRDRETAQMALSAAETGHLIFTTLHTKDAKGAITRITDLFPSDAQDDIRAQLSLSLRSVVSQHLLPSTVEGEKRVLATEVMHVNQPVRIGIRFGKIESIDSAIQTGRRDGMWSLDDELARLLQAGRISAETALKYAKDPEAMSGAKRR